MSWRLIIALVMAAVIVVRFMLLQAARRSRAAAERSASANRFPYPAGWPDERFQVPAGARPVATSVINRLRGAPGSVLSVDLGGVQFRGVGFSADTGARAVATDFSAKAEAAGFHRSRSLDKLTVGYESPDGQVNVYLSLDTASGPFTLWSTRR